MPIGIQTRKTVSALALQVSKFRSSTCMLNVWISRVRSVSNIKKHFFRVSAQVPVFLGNIFLFGTIANTDLPKKPFVVVTTEDVKVEDASLEKKLTNIQHKQGALTS